MNISSHANWINYKDKEIIYINYSGMLDDELRDAIQEANEFIKSVEINDNLILVDVRNSSSSEKLTVESLKESAKIFKKYSKKVAVIGVTPAQQVILTFVNMFSGLGIKPFEDEEDAKNWLVE